MTDQIPAYILTRAQQESPCDAPEYSNIEVMGYRCKLCPGCQRAARLAQWVVEERGPQLDSINRDILWSLRNRLTREIDRFEGSGLPWPINMTATCLLRLLPTPPEAPPPAGTGEER